MVIARSTPPGAGDPDDDRATERGSRVMRFGAAVSAVILASVIATMPAAVRISASIGAASGGVSLWVSLLALAFFPLAVATVVLRHALASLRLFDPRTVTTGVAAVLVWGLMTFVALSGLGMVLRATTHHHGLAGVTFGGGGTVVAAVLALFAIRVVHALRDGSPALRWAAIISCGLLVGVGVAFSAHVLARSEPASALCIDLIAFTFAAAFGAGAFPHRTRPLAPLALAGPPLAAVVLVVGFATLGGSAPLRGAVEADAPILSRVLAFAIPGGATRRVSPVPALTAAP